MRHELLFRFIRKSSSRGKGEGEGGNLGPGFISYLVLDQRNIPNEICLGMSYDREGEQAMEGPNGYGHSYGRYGLGTGWQLIEGMEIAWHLHDTQVMSGLGLALASKKKNTDIS